MKKTAVVAAIVASLFVSAPALALDVPTQEAWIAVGPCMVDCLAGSTHDAETGLRLDEFQFIDESAPFDAPAGAGEFDPNSEIAYFVTFGGQIFSFDVALEDDLAFLNNAAGLPTIDAAPSGLSIDDATGTLYLLYNDPDAGHYYVVSVDRETGEYGTPLALDASLNEAGAVDIAVAGGTIYVLTNDGYINTLRQSDGEATGQIAYPEAFGDPFAIDLSAGGVLRLVDDNAFWAYNAETEVWSEAVLIDDGWDGWAWYGEGEAPVAKLAETGVNASGIALAGGVLVLAGVAATVRRRTRR